MSALVAAHQIYKKISERSRAARLCQVGLDYQVDRLIDAYVRIDAEQSSTYS